MLAGVTSFVAASISGGDLSVHAICRRAQDPVKGPECSAEWTISWPHRPTICSRL